MFYDFLDNCPAAWVCCVLRDFDFCFVIRMYYECALPRNRFREEIWCWLMNVWKWTFEWCVHVLFVMNSFERVPGQEGKRERDHDLLFPCPGDCSGQDWAQPKPGARRLLQVSNVATGACVLGHLLHFPNHEQSTGWKVKQPGLEQVPLWNASITGGSFTCLQHSARLIRPHFFFVGWGPELDRSAKWFCLSLAVHSRLEIPSLCHV